MNIKNYLFNPIYSGILALLFFFFALGDLLYYEFTHQAASDDWAYTWEHMSTFGKIDAVLCMLLIVWTVIAQFTRIK